LKARTNLICDGGSGLMGHCSTGFGDMNNGAIN